MEHSQRIRIAKKVSEKLISKYKQKMKAVLLYGSTARNEDGPYSDIDLLAITSTKSGWSTYKIGGIALTINFRKEINDVNTLIRVYYANRGNLIKRERHLLESLTTEEKFNAAFQPKANIWK